MDTSGAVLARKVITVTPDATRLPLSGNRIFVGVTNEQSVTASAAKPS